MKLDNFKELLIKKTSDSPDLQLLLKYMRDDLLAEHVIESLEKMADRIKKVNDSLRHFGTHMDPGTEPVMIHDALSHHATQYKAALNQMNSTQDDSQKKKLKDIANAHMKKFFNIMHMTQKLTKDKHTDHSKGRLNVKEIDPKPWERNAYLTPGKKTGALSDTKGWSNAGSDYASWLSSNPHESYSSHTSKEKGGHGHEGAYPLEEIQVNGKYLDINPDKEAKVEKYVPHEFDNHPVMSVYKDSTDKHTDADKENYLNKYDEYQASPHMDSFFNRMDTMHPERGSVKSPPVHDQKPAAPAAPMVAPVGKEDAANKLAELQQRFAKLKGKM